MTIDRDLMKNTALGLMRANGYTTPRDVASTMGEDEDEIAEMIARVARDEGWIERRYTQFITYSLKDGEG